MTGAAGFAGRRRAFAAGLLALALFLRVLVPSGWMPMAGAGFSITLCTGMGAVQAWMDDKGEVHKRAPGQRSTPDQPCAFSGFAAALIAPAELGAAIITPILSASLFLAGVAEVAIGRGLAAPPPPPTGPPAFA